MRGIFIILCLLALFLPTAHVCAHDPVRIGVILAKTGQAAISNLPSFGALRFGVARINAAGGVLGRPVELVELDNQSTSIGSVLMAEQAILANVAGVIGPSWSSHALAAAQILQRAEIPMVATSATADAVTQTGDFIFRACFTDAFQGRVAARFALEDLGARRAAILVNVSNAYSIGLAKSFGANFLHGGGSIIYTGEYHSSTRNFTPQLSALNATKADVIFMPGYPRDSAAAIAQAGRMGITKIFLGGDSWGPMYKLPLEFDNTITAYCISHWHADAPFPQSKPFMKAYAASPYAPHDTELEAGNVLAYDTLNLLVSAIDRAGTTDPKAVRDALAATTGFVGVTGRFDYMEDGSPHKDAVVLKLTPTRLIYRKTLSGFDEAPQTPQ